MKLMRCIIIGLLLLAFVIATIKSQRFLENNESCFKLVELKDGKLVDLKINSGKWWSTTNVTYKVKNICDSPQEMSHLHVKIYDWKINGEIQQTETSIIQIGSPWLIINAQDSNDPITIDMNSQNCFGNYCDWAKVTAGGVHTIKVKRILRGFINSSSISGIDIDRVQPKKKGSLHIKVDSHDLEDHCSEFPCNMMLQIVDESSNNVIEFFHINPEDYSDQTIRLDGLYPNTYEMKVLDSTLPNVHGEIDIDFIPAKKIEVKAEEIAQASIKFNYQGVPKGHLTVTLDNIPQSFHEPIKGKLIDAKNNKEFPLTFTQNENSFTLNNLTAGRKFKIFVPGAADIGNQHFTEAIEVETQEVIKGKYIKEKLSYKKIEAGLFDVNFHLTAPKTDLNLDLIITEESRKVPLFQYQGVTIKLSTQKKDVKFKFISSEIVKITGDVGFGAEVFVYPDTIDKNNKKVEVEVKKKKVKDDLSIAGYYQSWSAKWVNSGDQLSLAHLPEYVDHILISFVNPNLNYKKGSETFSGTGLDFSMEFSVVKDAVEVAHKKNPNQKFILSVGGATYPFTSPNYQAIVDLMEDLGLDGIDIDYENAPSCSGVNTENLKCDTDEKISKIIDAISEKIPEGKLLSAAPFSVGAYGTLKFPNTKYLPASAHNGMWVNALKKSGHKLDALFLMTYDASDIYKPTDAFDAYRNIFKGDLYIGYQVPPEAWGGHVLTVDEALKHAEYVKDNQGKGVFIWSLQKKGDRSDAATYLSAVCKFYDKKGCNENIPLN